MDTAGMDHVSTKCMCLEGFVEDMDDPMSCIATSAPTYAPTEEEDAEEYVTPTQAPTWFFPKGYCAETNQRIAFWVIPLTEHAKCPEASLTDYQTIEYVPNTDPLLPPTRVVNDPFGITEEVCMEICSRTLGGPRGNCTYMDYDEDGACWISDKCGWHSDNIDVSTEDFTEAAEPGNRAGMEPVTPGGERRRRKLVADYHGWGKRDYNNMLNADGLMGRTSDAYDNPLSWDAGESLGIEMIHCEFIDSEAKTCVNSKVENQREVPHLTDCFDECRASETCVYYTYDENSGACELFQFCDGYMGAPFGSNQRLYMMSDELSYPQTSDNVLAKGMELATPLFPPGVPSAAEVEAQRASHGDAHGNAATRRTTATSSQQKQQFSVGQNRDLKEATEANLQMAQEMAAMKKALAENKHVQERLHYVIYALAGVGALMGWSMVSKQPTKGSSTDSRDQQHRLARTGTGNYRMVNPALTVAEDSI
jgi:hypothetical protein